MRISKWFQSLYPRAVRTRNTKAQASFCGRRSTFETLEDRRVLAAFTASLLSPGESIVEPAAAKSVARDLGDFYYSGSEQIPLLRYEDQVVVRIAEASTRDGVVSALTAGGAPLAGYALASAINSNMLILSKASGSPVLPAALTQAESLTGVEWVTPLFQAGEGGAWIAVNDEVIVALKPGVPAADFFGAEFSSWRPLLGTPDQFVATLADGAGLESLALANTLHTNPAVQWAVPNFYADVQRSLTASDALFGNQWHLNNTGQTGAQVDADSDLTAAWDITQGSSDVVIAVLDDGVQVNHPDLSIFTHPGEIAGNGFDDDGNGWIDDVNGWNFVIDENPSNDNNPNPFHADDNHGTAVAGVAAARGNSIGVSGSSRNARILPVKVFEGGSFVGYARAAEALYYAAGRTANGLGTWDAADIINMSFGTAGMTTNAAFDAAVAWATGSGRQGLGASIFAAAGNDADGTADDPGYRHFTLTGFTPNTYVLEWRYEKDGTVSAGDDTVWLANVRLPNGTTQRFDTPGLPAGWTTTSTTGQANTLWSVVDDPAHSYGTGRYVARSGDISDSQVTRFRSPAITVTSTGTLEYDAWVSSEGGFDGMSMYLSINGGEFNPYNPVSGVPIVNTAVSYPANLTNIVAVGASTDWDYRAAYSQFGSALDLVAPSNGGYGGGYTTDRTGEAGYNETGAADDDPLSALDYTSTFGGTSFAAPMTAGIAALMLSKNPNLSPAQIRTILQNSADKIGGNNGATAYASGFNQYYGHGRVNAHAALLATPTVAPTSVDLAAATDTGALNNDNTTSRDNSSVAKNLQFVVAGTVAGATVTLYSGATVIGFATASGASTTINTNGTFDLTDGSKTITAKQTEPGRPESTGVSLGIVIDTAAPTVADVKVGGGTGWSGLGPISFATRIATDAPDHPLVQGQQLRPIPTQNVTVIQIQFNEKVYKRSNTGVISDVQSNTTDGNALMLLQRTVVNYGPTDSPETTGTILADGFSYNPTTFLATWTYNTALGDGKFAIHLKSANTGVAGFVDLAGLRLNGDWTNNDNGTPDDFKNDPVRSFVMNDNIEGSAGDEFRFHFALLAGDYDGNGLVTATETVNGDGNGNGAIGDSGDVNLRDTHVGKYLPLRNVKGADLNDDDEVDAEDFNIWKMKYAMSGNAAAEGDVDGDGDTDGDDFLIWQRRLGGDSSWYIGDTNDLQAVVGDFAPWITNVIVSGSQSSHAAFSFNTVDGSGQQLRTVPVGASDTITIVFSEAVNVNADSLTLLGLRTANLPTLAAFFYDAGSNSATWRFEGWALGDQYLLILPDEVTDIDGNRLDGEWTNPNRIYQSGTSGAYFQNAAISEFPSGDGDPGGWFTFLMTLLPGDATQNGIIDSQDWSILGANMGPGPGKLFTQGDFNGDGAVNSTDVNYFYNPAVSNLQVFKVKADLNNDGVVNDYDLNIIGLHAGMTGATLADGDVNGDGSVTQADLDLALAQYGPWWDWVDMVA